MLRRRFISRCLLSSMFVYVGIASAAPNIHIENARTRSTAPGQTVSGGYMTLINNGPTADRLLSVSASWASMIEIHHTSMDGDVMRMREVQGGVPIPANSRVELKPRGMHLMLMQLAAPLEAGHSMPLLLQFEKAGAVKVSLRVEAAGQMP
ncbi:MAG: copper chaperone PCu(A)C [Gammaproteobacteria bacterium]|nr:copper chaperone PCu(A)C [Gammaproteobacteria bacterium]